MFNETIKLVFEKRFETDVEIHELSVKIGLRNFFLWNTKGNEDANWKRKMAIESEEEKSERASERKRERDNEGEGKKEIMR